MTVLEFATQAVDEEFPYLVCGISFHRTPVEIREKAALPPARVPEGLRYLQDQAGVRECMILSTCNRTELYLSAEKWLDGRDLFLRFARQICAVDLAAQVENIYVYRGLRAVRHLFRVAASLDSLIVGEPQILGQTKAAFRLAENLGAVDKDLHRWIPKAFTAAKQVRSQTGICESAVNVSYAAVQLAKKIFENLHGKKVVLIGAGRMGELAALHLREAGAASIVVVNRTLARAEEVASKCRGRAVVFEEGRLELAGADVVICAAESPHFILEPDGVHRILKDRARRPLLVLDIAVPRNVDPRVADIEGAYLFNVDDLEAVVQANREGRRQEAARAEAVLHSAVQSFLREESRSRMAPAIAAIRNQVRSICRTELERMEQKLTDLTPEQHQELEIMVHRIAQKILHPAMIELQEAGDGESAGLRLSLLEKIFGVGRKSSAV